MTRNRIKEQTNKSRTVHTETVDLQRNATFINDEPLLSSSEILHRHDGDLNSLWIHALIHHEKTLKDKRVGSDSSSVIRIQICVNCFIEIVLYSYRLKGITNLCSVYQGRPFYLELLNHLYIMEIRLRRSHLLQEKRKRLYKRIAITTSFTVSPYLRRIHHHSNENLHLISMPIQRFDRHCL